MWLTRVILDHWAKWQTYFDLRVKNTAGYKIALLVMGSTTIIFGILLAVLPLLEPELIRPESLLLIAEGAVIACLASILTIKKGLRWRERPRKDQEDRTVVLSFARAKPTGEPPSVAVARGVRRIHRKVLLRFPYSACETAQFSMVLRHLEKHRPDWLIDVVAVSEAGRVFHDLCHQVRILGRDRVDPYQYHEVLDVSWEQVDASQSRESSKAERSLREVFNLSEQVTESGERKRPRNGRTEW